MRQWRSASNGIDAQSPAKGVWWRAVGAAVISALVFLLTGRILLSLAVGATELVLDVGIRSVQRRSLDRLVSARRDAQAAVIWFTGLSGSGKSTVADRVAGDLQRRGMRVERLDGDTVRNIFPETGFTRPERDAHIRRVGYLASKLEKHGVFVVASFVSPYEDSRQFVRELCANFVEVHLATPLDECERRDAKGLYARARRGEIKHFTGIDDPYEPPLHPDVVVDTTGLTPDVAAAAVLAELRRRDDGLGAGGDSSNL
jgi:adenylylsulfate kinase